MRISVDKVSVELEAEQGLLDEALYSSFFCTHPLPTRIILIIIISAVLIPSDFHKISFSDPFPPPPGWNSTRPDCQCVGLEEQHQGNGQL